MILQGTVLKNKSSLAHLCWCQLNFHIFNGGAGARGAHLPCTPGCILCKPYAEGMPGPKLLCARYFLGRREATKIWSAQTLMILGNFQYWPEFVVSYKINACIIK